MCGSCAIAIIAVVIASAAPLAHADGDPASDYLIGQRVFFPYDVKFRGNSQLEFAKLVSAANAAGFKVRVALIASTYDLGSVTPLYRKPRAYARFLGAELGFVYKQRLLVVMPNGFGFNWPKHSPTAEYAILKTIPIRRGSDGLLAAARTAIERLTRAAGVRVSAQGGDGSASSTGTSAATITVIAAAAVLAAAGAGFALRRRSRQSAQDG